MLASSAIKCDHQALSERVLGYQENAETYTELAASARSMMWWVQRLNNPPPHTQEQRKYPVNASAPR